MYCQWLYWLQFIIKENFQRIARAVTKGMGFPSTPLGMNLKVTFSENETRMESKKTSLLFNSPQQGNLKS